MSDRERRTLRLRAIIALLLALIVLAILGTRRNQTLGLHQALQLDDFFFTVEEAVKQPVDPARANSTDPTQGEAEYRVRLKVENRALRVPFKFSGEWLAFVDLSGRRPVVRPSSERLRSGELAPPILHVLQAGDAATYEYIVPLTPDLPDLRLRIMPSGWTGDLLEWLFFGRKEFRLF